MTRSVVPLWSWNSPAPIAGNTGLYLSRSVSTELVDWCRNVYTPVRDTSRCDQRLEAAPHWHMGNHITKLWPATWSSASLTHGQSYHKTLSTKQLVIGECGYMQTWGKRTSLWTSAKLKPALFRANTLHNRLFSEPPAVYRGKHVRTLIRNSSTIRMLPFWWPWVTP